ncbi:MAG: right-handed parallel beta-helix repeat-containing protein [Candidatus Kerfeldbacteria bacterium]
MQQLVRFLGGAVVCIALLSPAAVFATDRYVACGGPGSDTGDCSGPVSPCLTPQYAEGQTNNGDTVYVQGTCTATASGYYLNITPDTDTVWTAWNSRPVIDCNNVANYGIGMAASRTTVRGFEIKNCVDIGIYATATPTGAVIEQNWLHDNGGACSDANIVSASSFAIIKNNIITDSACYGIRAWNNSQSIFHNTFVNNPNYAIYFSSGTSNSIRGNIIRSPSEATDYAVWYPQTATYQSFNNMFREGAVAKYRLAGTTYTGLGAWTAATGLDTNSVEADPMLEETTWHIGSVHSPAIDTIAAKSVNYDFDGQTRPQSLQSDYGADEYFFGIPEYSAATAAAALVFGAGFYLFYRRKRRFA